MKGPSREKVGCSWEGCRGFGKGREFCGDVGGPLA